MPPRAFPFVGGTGRNYLARMRAVAPASSSAAADAVAGRGPLPSPPPPPPPPPPPTRWSSAVGSTAPAMEVDPGWIMGLTANNKEIFPMSSRPLSADNSMSKEGAVHFMKKTPTSMMVQYRSFTTGSCCGKDCICCQQLTRIGDLLEKRAETETKHSESEAAIAKTLQDTHADVKVWLASVQSAPPQTSAPAGGLFRNFAFEFIDAGLKIYSRTTDEKSEHAKNIKIVQELLVLLRSGSTLEVAELVYRKTGASIGSLLERMILAQKVRELSGARVEAADTMTRKMDTAIDCFLHILEKFNKGLVKDHPQFAFFMILMTYLVFIVPFPGPVGPV